ncbi:40-residue YVTN family beta-propeller repeat-containing protein, partial [Streptomyces sp. DvalAA-14]|uniref:IPT/TIG domain-containing protein n=1 Tax=unclassified Streptomyces TaxID=2593676 RepID=UPI00081B79CE
SRSAPARRAWPVTPDGSQVYATNLGSDTVSAIDTASGTVAATTAVGRNPSGVAIVLTPAPAAPAPVVTSVSPGSGPVTGGTVVTVGGSHLADVTAVTFGGTPAASFSCSDSSCTAAAPAGAAGSVDVTATSPAGTSATGPADRFTYTAVAPQSADVAVSLAASPAPALLGAHIDYTLTLADQGPGAASSTTVTVNLPTPLKATSSDCAATAGKVTCSAGPLAAGARTTRHFSVPIGVLSLDLPYSVTATRTASSPADPNPANDRATRTCTVVTSLLINCS